MEELLKDLKDEETIPLRVQLLLTQDIYVNLDNAIDYDQNGYSLLKTFDGQVKMLQEQSNDDLIFDSRFECGNLAYAFRRHDTLLHEYDLFMQSDTNTVGYCQWFNFALRNMRKNIEYRFNIVNFVHFALI